MIEILCSGVSLGHYVPGLLIRDRLRALGIEARVRVFERLLDPERQTRVNRTRSAYHADTRMASTAQRLFRTLAPTPLAAPAAALLQAWSDEASYLIVLSGFWIPMVRQWVAEDSTRRRAQVELFHVDTSESPGWSAQQLEPGEFRRSWWCKAGTRSGADGRGRLELQLPIAIESAEPTPAGRVLVHGGGWGIGDYRSVVPRLLDAGLQVDLVLYEEADGVALPAGVRGLLIEPDFTPCVGPVDAHVSYPPFRLQGEGAAAPRGHGLLPFAASALAIVSKPGGASLIDSLAAATPMAFLSAFGEHEAANADVWTNLGGGTAFEAWQARGFDRAWSVDSRLRLIELRDQTPSYPDAFARRIGALS